MERKGKGDLFLGIILLLVIIIAIFAFGNRKVNTLPMESKEHIHVLNDSIKSLKEDISRYKSEIERIDLERESIRKELIRIIEDNEKIDSELANGDWDANMRFLTDFLSEEDSVGE